MGTLFEQKPRSSFSVDEKEVKNHISSIKRIATSNNLTFDQVLRVYENLEHKRQNDVFVNNGDIHDEQMSGIGELLNTTNEKLGCLFETIENN